MAEKAFKPGWLKEVVDDATIETLTWPEGYRESGMACKGLSSYSKDHIRGAIKELRRRIKVLEGELQIRKEYEGRND